MLTTEHPVHTDPHFFIRDETVFARFLKYANIHPANDHGEALMNKVCLGLSRIPYENLTKIIKSDATLSTGGAKRLPDELLRDFLTYGTGGTCFSLTAAFVAVFNALGIEAHPILADRYYGTDTHCALVFIKAAELFLLDPGYLIYTPTKLPTTLPITITTGFNTIELLPHEAGRKVELVTIVNNDRRSRLTYKVTLVDGPAFGRAWQRSFAWEMMTYPVLTRYGNGIHYYLQGSQLRIRDHAHTIRQKLTPEEQQEFIRRTFGINKTIIAQAFAVI